MKRGIKVETFKIAGRYQHNVYDIGVESDRVGELSYKVVEALKGANEKVWEETPEGVKGLVAIIQYEIPKKSK